MTWQQFQHYQMQLLETAAIMLVAVKEWPFREIADIAIANGALETIILPTTVCVVAISPKRSPNEALETHPMCNFSDNANLGVSNAPFSEADYYGGPARLSPLNSFTQVHN